MSDINQKDPLWWKSTNYGGDARARKVVDCESVNIDKNAPDRLRTVSTILHHSHPYFIYEVIMKYI